MIAVLPIPNPKSLGEAIYTPQMVRVAVWRVRHPLAVIANDVRDVGWVMDVEKCRRVSGDRPKRGGGVTRTRLWEPYMRCDVRWDPGRLGMGNRVGKRTKWWGHPWFLYRRGNH